MAHLEANCTVLVTFEESTSSLKESDLQKKLESKDDKVKIEGLKQIILLTLNGQSFPKLLMSVIKYTLHSESHLIKKLLLMYWEVVQKKNKDGVLLHEMILVCNAMKNNLNHANEYIRGSTLRFLCHLQEVEILESLIPSITANLEHRHSYVRKNAVLCTCVVYENFPELIPDAPELVEQLLYSETNPSAKRNAFYMLITCDQERAVNYLTSIVQTIQSQSESFQLLVLELIRKVCRANPSFKSMYIHSIFNLVNSPAHAVSFEGANTLVALSSAPTAVRAAINAYCQLLTSESDNNIKLIILARISSLRKRNEKILQEMLMDILRTLQSPNIDIRRKTLALALDLVSPRNVGDVITLLKKEMASTDSLDGKDGKYRKLLVDAMHKCAVKFPDVVPQVVQLLMNYLGDENSSSALDVVYFVREVVEEYPTLRGEILTKLIENFDQIRCSNVYRVALWILGEYAADSAVLDVVLLTIREAVGALPLLQPRVQTEEEKVEEEEEEDPFAPPAAKKGPVGPVVLADGTYASQSSVAADTTATAAAAAASAAAGPTLRTLIVGGDYFLGACLGCAVTKLMLRFVENAGATAESSEEVGKAILLMVSVLRLGGPANPDKKYIDIDSSHRLTMCVRVLLDPAKYKQLFLARSRETFAAMMLEQREKAGHSQQDKKIEVVSQADSLISVRQLKNKLEEFDEYDNDADLSRALGGPDTKTSKLNRVYQLTGFADSVYAEAALTVLDYDIVLDILIVNQTDAVLQNLCVELNTSGDLKVVERPNTVTLAPFGAVHINANIKVKSTESGVIFGNIVYDSSSGTSQNIVVMNNIHMDIMDYIGPAVTTDVKFRSMWAEFEWENKVAVNTDIADLSVYLRHIMNITNMACMTPQATMSGSCMFLAANLYARSIFNEDALLNLSVELDSKGKVGGYIRIRSKTQGIALSLGDKIQAKQRNLPLTKA